MKGKEKGTKEVKEKGEEEEEKEEEEEDGTYLRLEGILVKNI
jgi:hypothetical protein